MKFLELASKILSETKIPMSASEIWNYAIEKDYARLLDTVGTTPQFTLSSRLYTAANDESNLSFHSIGNRPKLFYIPSVTPKSALIKVEEIERVDIAPKFAYKEKDLHKVLAHFVYTNLDAYPKTINHAKSRKTHYSEWLHPDMVACSFPKHHWKSSTYELSQQLGDAQIILYSFELKISLSFVNLRESFFQAVSNSSWAHFGYLAASEIDQDYEFQKELVRLCNSFGIGVILLVPNDPELSEILIDADENQHIDWEMVNKLTINSDFSEFIDRIKRDINSKEIREEWYDKLIDAPQIAVEFKSK